MRIKDYRLSNKKHNIFLIKNNTQAVELTEI